MEEANKEHVEAGTHQTSALLHAKKAGDALVEAKHRIRYKEWGKFAANHFKGSRETRIVYMRIARKWEDPRIQGSRKGNMCPNSIKGFLDIVSSKRQPRQETTSEQQQELNAMRHDMYKEFARQLPSLDKAELKVLHETWYRYLWPVLYDWVKHFVCLASDCDCYDEGNAETEELKRAAREKVGRVLNPTAFRASCKVSTCGAPTPSLPAVSGGHRGDEL
jgi:hypothetical protein